MNDPLLSCILCAYNAEKTLARTLGSLLCRADLNQFEVILINDGSTDDTSLVVNSFKSLLPNLRVFSQENHGLGYSRNRGIKQARGKYVTFCDADDIFIIENQLETARSCSNQEMEIGCASGFSMIENTHIEKFWDHHVIETMANDGSNTKLQYLKFLLQPSVCTKIFKRSFLIENKIQFTEKNIFEDVEFTYHAFLLTNKILIKNTPVFIYDVYGKGSITTTQNFRNFELFENMLTVIRHANLHQLSGPAQLALASSLMRISLWCYDNTATQYQKEFLELIIQTMFCFERLEKSNDDFYLLKENIDQWDRRAINAVSKLWKDPSNTTDAIDFIQAMRHIEK